MSRLSGRPRTFGRDDSSPAGHLLGVAANLDAAMEPTMACSPSERDPMATAMPRRGHRRSSRCRIRRVRHSRRGRLPLWRDRGGPAVDGPNSGFNLAGCPERFWAVYSRWRPALGYTPAEIADRLRHRSGPQTPSPKRWSLHTTDCVRAKPPWRCRRRGRLSRSAAVRACTTRLTNKNRL
jgi:hypothetical protein